MSRNARDSDLGYFILATILCNLISLNVLHGDVKHHGVSSSPFLYQIFFNVACFRFRWHFFPMKKKKNNKKQEVNIIRTGRAGEENILFEAPQKLCLSGGP